MAKGNSKVRGKKSRSSKPYDVSDSFVSKVTSRVSTLLPRLSSWLTPHRPKEEEEDSSTEDEGEVEDLQPPPPKRARSELNEPLSDNLGEDSELRNTLAFENHHDQRPPLGFLDGRIAGPSGVSHRPALVSSTPAATHLPPFLTHASQPLNQFMNGDKDHSQQSDSSVSTSGCSSLVPQGKYQAERRRYPSTNSRSAYRTSVGDRDGSSFLHTSRTTFPDHSATYTPSPRPSSAQSKRPSFNASVFSNPLSPSLGSLSSDKVPLSPFYLGRTQYGGASSYRKPRTSLFSPSVSPLPSARGVVHMRPVNKTNLSDLNSCTARRILEALDHLSSPVLDARRMLLTSLPALDDSSSRKRPAPEPASSSPRRAGGPSTRDLTIPSLPDLLKLQRKVKMQDSVEAARQVAYTDTTGVTAMEREYRRRLDGEDQPKVTGKMTSRMRELEQEMCEEVNLPNIALPISTLPSFDFVASKLPSFGFAPSKPSAPKYTFSKPTPLDAEEFLSSDQGVNNFLSTSSETSRTSSLGFMTSGSSSCFSDSSKVNNSPNFIPYCPSKSDSPFGKPALKEKSSPLEVTKNNGQNGKVNFSVSVAGELKVGSAMNFFGKPNQEDRKQLPSGVPVSTSFGDMFKPAPGSWECGACMVRNTSQATACLSCTTPRPTATPTAATALPTFGFSTQFKKPAGSWECSDCMTSNTSEAVSCVCCTKSKPVAKVDADTKSQTTGFGSQFKPADGEWECTACMLRNKKDVSSCVACTTPKAGARPAPKTDSVTPAKSFSGFGNQFKPSSNTWECPDCMLRMSNDLNVCRACEAKMPGAELTNNKHASATAGFGDMFKKPEGAWDCPSCMIQNKHGDKCVACEELKPGSTVSDKETTLPASTIKFNFGIPSEASSFKFGIDKADVASKKPEPTAPPSFMFGSSPQVASEAKTFVFGIPKTASADSKVSDASAVASKSLVPSSQPVTIPSEAFAIRASPKSQVSVSSAGTALGSNGGDRKRRVEETSEEQPAEKIGTLFASKETSNKLFGVSNQASVTTSTFALPTPPTVTPSATPNGPTTVVPSATSSGAPATSAPANLFAFGTYNSKPGATFGSGSTTLFGTTPAAKGPSSLAEPSKPLPALFDFGTAAAKQNKVAEPSAHKPMFGSAIAPSTEGGFGGLASSALSFAVNASNLTTPSFGDSATKTTPLSFASTIPAPSFGGFSSTAVASSAPGPPASTPFLFGSNASKPAAPVFSSSKEETFSFGSGASATPKAAGFSFGSQHMTTVAEPLKSSAGIFSFGAASAPQKAAGPFGFGTNSNGLSNTTSTFGANASNPSPVFGSPAPPSFGSLPTTQSGPVGTATGFSFGSGSSQPSSTVFGFGGGSQPAVPSTGGFAFGQATPPTFNPNVPPTFNFTAGETPNFTAAGCVNPSAAAQPRRIIKKAVRRTPR